MALRPKIEDGWLGPQTNFSEFGLSTKSHDEPEFETSENEFVIKLVSSQEMKMTGKVINEVTGKESLERVFVQMNGRVITLFVSLDTLGYHRLQIYALPASNESKELPGVYNYLINCTGMGRKSRFFPKQFARWGNGCVLLEPFTLSGDSVSGNIKFRVIIPEAHAVAVTLGENNWCHLEPEIGDNDSVIWTGNVEDIQQYKQNGNVAVLNANLDLDDESKYYSLLQWTL